MVSKEDIHVLAAINYTASMNQIKNRITPELKEIVAKGYSVVPMNDTG